ncbi:MAG: effector binding domain-containing protein [Ginsengibacter sp.]
MTKVKISSFRLVGLRLEKKTTNENGQSSVACGSLWKKFEEENIAQKIPNKLTDEVYAVYFDYEGDYTQPFSYFIGCKVIVETETSPNLDTIVVPEDTYKKIVAKGSMPACLTNSWKEIWNSQIERAYHYDFEIYDERSKNWSDAEVDIFVSSL